MHCISCLYEQYRYQFASSCPSTGRSVRRKNHTHWIFLWAVSIFLCPLRSMLVWGVKCSCFLDIIDSKFGQGFVAGANRVDTITDRSRDESIGSPVGKKCSNKRNYMMKKSIRRRWTRTFLRDWADWCFWEAESLLVQNLPQGCVCADSWTIRDYSAFLGWSSFPTRSAAWPWDPWLAGFEFSWKLLSRWRDGTADGDELKRDRQRVSTEELLVAESVAADPIFPVLAKVSSSREVPWLGGSLWACVEALESVPANIQPSLNWGCLIARRRAG